MQYRKQAGKRHGSSSFEAVLLGLQTPLMLVCIVVINLSKLSHWNAAACKIQPPPPPR